MIIIGFLVGLLARAVMPGNDRLGIIFTIVLGIIGSFLGGFLGQTMGWAQTGEPVSIFASVMGALLVLFVLRAVNRPAQN